MEKMWSSVRPLPLPINKVIIVIYIVTVRRDEGVPQNPRITCVAERLLFGFGGPSSLFVKLLLLFLL